jgi:hypothetical protein
LNIVLSTDHLLFRQESTGLLDMACELFPEARAYTLAHEVGAVLGHLEQRPIKSTGLSRKVKSLDDLQKRAFLVPGLVGQIPVSCTADVIFNLSHGLSHGIPKCENTFLWTYLYDLELVTRKPQGLRERLFRPYVRSWALKQLAQVDLLWVPTDALKTELAPFVRGEVEVVPPFLKLSDYPLIPSKSFKKDFYLIHATALTESEARTVIDVLNSRGLRWRFMGGDDHLQALKKEQAHDAFFGERCSGELAPMLAACRGVIDLDARFFPSETLKALSQGKRVIRKAHAQGEVFVDNEYTYPLQSLGPQELNAAVDWIEGSWQTDEPQKIRAFSMDFHDLKFKGALQRSIKKIEERKASVTNE